MNRIKDVDLCGYQIKGYLSTVIDYISIWYGASNSIYSSRHSIKKDVKSCLILLNQSIRSLEANT